MRDRCCVLWTSYFAVYMVYMLCNFSTLSSLTHYIKSPPTGIRLLAARKHSSEHLWIALRLVREEHDPRATVLGHVRNS